MLLRQILTEEEWHAYQVEGHITTKTDHGIYQIFYNQVRFYQDNQYAASLCVIFTDAAVHDPDLIFPLSDWLIMRYLLIKGDPERFWRTAEISATRFFTCRKNHGHCGIHGHCRPFE